MKYYLMITFLLLVLLSFSLVSGDYREREFHSFDPSEMVDNRVIDEWDPDPSHRVETFTNKPDWIGISTDGSNQYTIGYTTNPAESFDGSALYLTSPDDVNWISGYTNLWPGNSSSFSSFEFDILWESESDKGFAIDIWDTSDDTLNFKLNISTDSNSDDGLYTVYDFGYKDYHHIDNSFEIGYVPSCGVWHHVIISFVDNIVDGFEVTIVFDNVTFNWTKDKQDVSTSHDWRFRIKPEESVTPEANEYGMDLIIDNIACYNTSYNTEDINNAIASFYEVPGTPDPDGEVEGIDLFALLPAILMILMFTMLFKKFKF